MRLQFSWDGQTVTATPRNVVLDAEIEQMLSRRAFKTQLLNNLKLNARLDSLDDIEAAWWAVQEAYQQTPTPELLAQRDALEADNPWLASYRGEAAGSRPDVSAEVLARCQAFGRRWYIGQVRERFDDEFTLGGYTIKLDELTRALINARSNDMAAGNAYGTPKVAIPLADDSDTVAITEAQFNALVTAMRDRFGNGGNWMHGNVQSVNGAADLDALWTALS